MSGFLFNVHNQDLEVKVLLRFISNLILKNYPSVEFGGDEYKLKLHFFVLFCKNSIEYSKGFKFDKAFFQRCIDRYEKRSPDDFELQKTEADKTFIVADVYLNKNCEWNNEVTCHVCEGSHKVYFYNKQKESSGFTKYLNKHLVVDRKIVEDFAALPDVDSQVKHVLDYILASKVSNTLGWCGVENNTKYYNINFFSAAALKRLFKILPRRLQLPEKKFPHSIIGTDLNGEFAKYGVIFIDKQFADKLRGLSDILDVRHYVFSGIENLSWILATHVDGKTYKSYSELVDKIKASTHTRKPYVRSIFNIFGTGVRKAQKNSADKYIVTSPSRLEHKVDELILNNICKAVCVTKDKDNVIDDLAIGHEKCKVDDYLKEKKAIASIEF